MGLKLEYVDGQTPLDENESEGLKIKSISTHRELDELEHHNIEKALEWIFLQKLNRQKILTDTFIKSIHKRMFGQIWKWAGTFRKSEKNIGVDWIHIPVELKTLLDDTNYWIENQTYSSEEIAIRFKHRLVRIHCFANGNGRHSRILADILMESVFKLDAFSWNQSNMVKPDSVRKVYINALKEADKGNIKSLLQFAKG